jgi:hypothetical protein
MTQNKETWERIWAEALADQPKKITIKFHSQTVEWTRQNDGSYLQTHCSY